MLDKQILILASSSPRRLELLKSVFINPDNIISPDINEQRLPAEKPEKMALRLAIEKAKKVAENTQDESFILAADTIVATKAKIFDKTLTEEDAIKYLRFFSGRRIHVNTAVSAIKVKNGIIDKIATKLVVTNVKFRRLSEDEIKNYIQKTDVIGIAGGFAIQGLGETLVQWISGSYSGVVGLPLSQTVNLLQGIGYHGTTKSKS